MDSKGLGWGRKVQLQVLCKGEHLGWGSRHQQGLGEGHSLGRGMVQGASMVEQEPKQGLRGARLPHGG